MRDAISLYTPRSTRSFDGNARFQIVLQHLVDIIDWNSASPALPQRELDINPFWTDTREGRSLASGKASD
ncbi:uncharacterized protein BO88DRAFT_85074 [Aspergillus vadensis CBS 113365]|uniref:Uncharacterized protein n=1 Tax=Aspergillus vadensis (strain CBS 113365 / IMI 142717 / IBT 24658) TaxID=1448311 RepID=A0A319B412_ASPVC|nr:hypothetical protein BO88DRAFT_85074 [Aspergillus vadensis CBS 113365]PYH67199.1 hypothetical protein BO88DRAFT_85074 [Aspergillus vadensis CBS 113365]